MTPDRYNHLMELFDQACALPREKQSALLERIRASTPDLADELRRLLVEDQKQGDFFADDDGHGRLDVAALVDDTDLDVTTGTRPSSARPEIASLDLGTVIAGRYRLDALLGSGAAGYVYRARDMDIDADTDNGSDVAIKLLRPDLLDHPGQVQRFRREFRAISRIAHPNCLAVLAEGVHKNQRYIVMEYVSGGNLGRLIGAPHDILFPVLIRLASALDCVHSRRIIHRDVKPANVLLAAGEPPVPKLADFGIVKLADDLNTQLTETGAVLGTIDYMAPEILGAPSTNEQGDRDRFDPRCDLYSFGCVMFQLWAGRPPFIGTFYQRLRARLDSEAPPLRTVAASAPPELEALVAGLLQRDPALRPQRASDVARALRDIWVNIQRTSATTRLDDPLAELAPSIRQGASFLYRPSLIGRDSEIATLEDCIEEAATAPVAQLIALSGHGGIGKSALVAAIKRRLATRDVRTIVVHHRGMGRTPFAPFPAVLAALPGNDDHADHETTPRAPAETPADEHTPRPQRYIEDAAAARTQLARKVAERMRAVHRERPLVLILEDLHNAEPNAFTLLADILGELDPLTNRRPVIVATLRPAGRHYLAAIADVAAHSADRPKSERLQHITIEPLSSAAIRQLTAAMLATADSAVSEHLVSHLLTACEGNPLLIQSALHALVDGGHLRLRGSTWHLDGEHLPQTVDHAVSQLLRARLELLSPAAQSILKVAAIAGQAFDADLLVRVAAASEETVLDALDEAIRAAIVKTLPGHGNHEQYAFAHDRLREAVRADMDDDERTRLHQSAAEVLEQRGTASEATLAFHFARGRDQARAFHYLRRAGLSAFQARDFQAAQHHLSAALKRIDSVDQGQRQPAQMELLEFLADAALAHGHTRTSISHLQKLIALSRNLTDKAASQARWLRKLGLALVRTERLDEGLNMMERSLTLLGDRVPRRRFRRFARIGGDILVTTARRLLRLRPRYAPGGEELALVHRELGLMYRWIDLERLAAHSTRFIRLAYRLGVKSYLIEAHAGLATLYSLMTRPNLASRYYDRAVELARESHDLQGLVLAQLGRGAALSVISTDPQNALTYCDQAVDIAQQLGDRVIRNFALIVRGTIYTYLGIPSAAQDDYRQALALADDLNIPWLQLSALSGLALIDVFCGKFPSSVAAANRILASNIRLSLPALEANANEVLGMEAVLSGHFRDAVRYFDYVRAHCRTHRLDNGWGVMSNICHIDARLCLADEQGADAVPDLLPVLRGGIRLFRRMSRVPGFRGCDSLVRGIYQARRGKAREARRLFAKAREMRARAVPISYVDMWCDARIAFECLRLGDAREDVAKKLDALDDAYQAIGVEGMRLWLKHMRRICRV